MTAKKLFCLLLMIFTCSLFFSSCSGGEELCRIEGKEYTFVLFGSPNSVSRVSVVGADGAEVASVEPEYRVNEPWLSEDRENYGFELRDLDGDGDEDFTIKTVRTAGKEKYLFYMNKGNGEFKLESDLSGVVAPVFADGTVSFKKSSRIDQPTYSNEPPVYELREDECVYGWSERGRLEVRELYRFSYFSETDIYCYAVYIPNEEGELEVDSQKWIYPEKLSDYGFEPLE